MSTLLPLQQRQLACPKPTPAHYLALLVRAEWCPPRQQLPPDHLHTQSSCLEHSVDTDHVQPACSAHYLRLAHGIHHRLWLAITLGPPACTDLVMYSSMSMSAIKFHSSCRVQPHAQQLPRYCAIKNSTLQDCYVCCCKNKFCLQGAVIADDACCMAAGNIGWYMTFPVLCHHPAMIKGGCT